MEKVFLTKDSINSIVTSNPKIAKGIGGNGSLFLNSGGIIYKFDKYFLERLSNGEKFVSPRYYDFKILKGLYDKRSVLNHIIVPLSTLYYNRSIVGTTMEYFNGSNLISVVNESPQFILTTCYHLLSAICELVDNGIVSRELSLFNVMYNQDEIRIIDNDDKNNTYFDSSNFGVNLMYGNYLRILNYIIHVVFNDYNNTIKTCLLLDIHEITFKEGCNKETMKECTDIFSDYVKRYKYIK